MKVSLGGKEFHFDGVVGPKETYGYDTPETRIYIFAAEDKEKVRNERERHVP